MLIKRHGGIKLHIITNECFENEYVNNSDGETLFVTSESDKSCKFVKKLLNSKIFERNDVAFKATGLLDNLNELITNAELEGITLCEGNGHGVFVKKYPACYGIISKNQADKIIDEWVCTIYERRFLFVFESSKKDAILRLLQETAYDENIVEKLWPFLNLLIENAADAPCHNSFVVSYKKDFADLIQKAKTG